MLSYFGTDQSQVQRYLSGKSVRESQLGLLFNGLLKVPMQFFILLTGVMVFVFYQLNPSPLNFSPTAQEAVVSSEYYEEYKQLEEEHARIENQKKNPVSMKRFEVEPLLKSADIWRLESHFDDVRQFLRKIIDNLAILIKPCQGGPIGRRDIIG